MNEFVNLITRIFTEWYAEIIAALVGMALIWILGLLPAKFQYHKRLNFALKVKKAISKIDISIETKECQKISQIKDELKGYFDDSSIDEFKSRGNEFSFFSNESGVTYNISSINDEEIKKCFIIVSCMNTFNVGFFGRIIGLKGVTNEIQDILDSFNSLRKNKDKLTVHIIITPRWKFLKDEGINVGYSDRNFETSYTVKNIKIVNKGTAYLRENIGRVFYEWMTSLL